MLLESIYKQLRHAEIDFNPPQKSIAIAAQPANSQLRALTAQQLLMNNELFVNLSAAEINYLSKQAIMHISKAGDIIIHANDTDNNSMFLIAEGLMQAQIINPNTGAITQLGKLTGGDYFGETSLLLGEPRSATIVATTESIYYELSKQTLQQIIADRPKILEGMSELLTSRKTLKEQLIFASSLQERSLEKSKTTGQLLSRLKTWLMKK